MPLDDALREWVARWVRLAEGDLAMARLGLASDGFDVFELVGFHAQQAVEKLVKAYLARRAVEFGDVHDIDTLQRLVARVDGRLAEKLDPAAALTRYAVGTRYPGRYARVTREQAETAVQIAESIHSEILPRLQK
jgi:HEPN domain-containing protein